MLEAKTLDWISQRGIDPELAAKFGLKSCKLPGGGDGIAIPYFVGSEAVNHKYRSLAEKRFSQDKDAVSCFWNHNALVDVSLREMPLVITEGELDALAALQCGLARVVSVPTGAPQTAISDAPTTKYAYLDHASSALKEIHVVILAVDGDNAGDALMQDLALRIGKAKCKYVKYPYADETKSKRLKDLNEVLQVYGENGVRAVIDRAQWVEVDGVYAMSELPPYPERKAFRTGFDCLNEHLNVRMGDFSVVTGIPGHGKTTWVNDLVCRMACNHDWVIAIASFEQHPQADHRRNLRQWFNGRVPHMQSPQMLAEADAWIDKHFRFIVPGDDDLANLQWTLDKAATAVVRHNAKMIVIDPWNELDHDRPSDMSLTEYTGKSIKELKLLARRLNVHVMVVVHPTKLQTVNGEASIPGLYDISDCYSDDTEVLTKRGWILHQDMTGNDEVMAFNLENDAISWEIPSRILQHNYTGDMLNFKGYGFDLLVSPNHRLVVKPAWTDPVGTQVTTGFGRPTIWPKNEWSFVEAKNLPSGCHFKMPKAGMPIEGDASEFLLVHGKVFPAEPFMELIGWWIAEGYWTECGIGLCQSIGGNVDKIDALIHACGLSPTKAEREDRRGFKNMVTWYFGAKKDPEFIKWIKGKCGKGSAGKKVPYPAFCMSVRLKLALLNGYISGDGHRPLKRGGMSACTTSKGLSDDLMRLAVELGIPVTGHAIKKAKETHSQCYQINFGRPQRSEITMRGCRHMKTVPYEGKIWCLTVSTGAYVTRRNGAVVICGNSAHWANKADVGVVIHRKKQDRNEVMCRVVKSRYHEEIGRPGTVWLAFDQASRKYHQIPEPNEENSFSKSRSKNHE